MGCTQSSTASTAQKRISAPITLDNVYGDNSLTGASPLKVMESPIEGKTEYVYPEIGFVVKTFRTNIKMGQLAKVFINMTHHNKVKLGAYIANAEVITKDKSGEDCSVYTISVSSITMLQSYEDESVRDKITVQAITYINQSFNDSLSSNFKVPNIARGFLGELLNAIPIVTITEKVTNEANLNENVGFIGKLDKMHNKSKRDIAAHDDEDEKIFTQEEMIANMDALYALWKPAVKPNIRRRSVFVEDENKVLVEKIIEETIIEGETTTDYVPELVKGALKKKGHYVQNWKIRQFVIEAGTISYYEDIDMSHPFGKGLKDRIPLGGYEVKKISANQFHLCGKTDKNKKDLLLECQAKDNAESYVDIWINSINKHIEYADRIIGDKPLEPSSSNRMTSMDAVKGVLAAAFRRPSIHLETHSVPSGVKGSISSEIDNTDVTEKSSGTEEKLMPPSLKTGWCNKQGHFISSIKKRYFVLDSGIINYYVDRNDKPPYGTNYKGNINLTRCTIEKSLKDSSGIILKHFNADGSNITTFFNVVTSSKLLSKYDINTLDDWVNSIKDHINYANLCLDKSNTHEHHLADVLYPIKKVIADKNIINVFLHSNDKVVATSPVVMKSPIVCARQILIVESPNNNLNGKIYKVFFIDLTQMDNKETLYITSHTKVNEIDQDTFEIVFDSKIIIKCTDTTNGFKYWNYVISQLIPNL